MRFPKSSLCRCFSAYPYDGNLLTTDPTFPGGTKWCVCHFPELYENSFYSPCLLSLFLGWELTGNAICLYVLSHQFTIGISNRIYLPILPFSPPLVLFLTTKPTTDMNSCTLGTYVSEIQHRILRYARHCPAITRILPFTGIVIQSRIGGRTSYNAGTRTTTDDLQVILYSKIATIQAKKQIINARAWGRTRMCI